MFVYQRKGRLPLPFSIFKGLKENGHITISPFFTKNTKATGIYINHCTPLSYAVRNARLSVIELMLKRGGDVQKGQLLQYAVCRDEELKDVMSLLIDRGAPLNATMYQDGPTFMRFAPMSLGTALHVATEQGKTNAMRHLIHLGADTSVKDANGDTGLEWAQKWDKTEMLQLTRDLEDRS